MGYHDGNLSGKGLILIGFYQSCPSAHTNVTTLNILPQIKTYGFSVCIFLQLILQFVLTEIYPPIEEHIGLIGWIAFFAAACLCNALFAIFLVNMGKIARGNYEVVRLIRYRYGQVERSKMIRPSVNRTVVEYSNSAFR